MKKMSNQIRHPMKHGVMMCKMGTSGNCDMPMKPTAKIQGAKKNKRARQVLPKAIMD